MMKKKPDRIVYGTQYYRAPTPLPAEWEQDISNMRDMDIGALQVRVQWRWNEPREGQYRFDDVDRLFDLAAKYGRKVMFKFMLETAPQYVFDRYDGFRRLFDGTPILPMRHGAYYVGGWWPCFENPHVREAATRFIRAFVERYRDRPELILWNVWNEPRVRPAGDCCCKHSHKGYQQWLADEFKSIEAYNDFYGVAEESFETIPVPGSTQGYSDYFMFAKYNSSVSLGDRIRWVADTIRKLDQSHMIMVHPGHNLATQTTIDDICDDFAVAQSVDRIGTSYAAMDALKSRKDEIYCMLINDYMRSLDQHFFVHELYPNWGDWHIDQPIEDMRFKVYSILACASKGIAYWQFRRERVGCENNLTGLIEMDGRINEHGHEAARIGHVIENNRDVFDHLESAPAEIAILYDFDSSLISRVEDGSPIPWSVGVKDDPLCYYANAHTGWYEALYETSTPTQYLHTRDLSALGRYKVACAPYMPLVSPEIGAQLLEFVQNGGVLLLDEGFALRDANTWVAPSSPAPAQAALTPARWTRREAYDGKDINDMIELPTGTVSVMPMRTVYESDQGTVLARFSDGTPAIREFKIGSGRVVLMGCSLGYSYRLRGERAWSDWLSRYLGDLDLSKNPCDDAARGIHSRLCTLGGDPVWFVFNRSDVEQTVAVRPGCKRELTGECALDAKSGQLTLPAKQVAILVY